MAVDVVVIVFFIICSIFSLFTSKVLPFSLRLLGWSASSVGSIYRSSISNSDEIGDMKPR